MAMIAAVAALFVGTGTSHAGLDNELNLIDGGGRTMTIHQCDTLLNGVFPLDRNRLTREWFHSGKAVYSVVGQIASVPQTRPTSLAVGAWTAHSFPVVVDTDEGGQV